MSDAEKALIAKLIKAMGARRATMGHEWMEHFDDPKEIAMAVFAIDFLACLAEVGITPPEAHP